MCANQVIHKIIRPLVAPKINLLNMLDSELYYTKMGIIGTFYNYNRENALGKKLLELNSKAFANVYPHKENEVKRTLIQVQNYWYETKTGINVPQIDTIVKAYSSLKFWMYQASDCPEIEKSDIWKVLLEYKMELADIIINEVISKYNKENKSNIKEKGAADDEDDEDDEDDDIVYLIIDQKANGIDSKIKDFCYNYRNIHTQHSKMQDRYPGKQFYILHYAYLVNKLKDNNKFSDPLYVVAYIDENTKEINGYYNISNKIALFTKPEYALYENELRGWTGYVRKVIGANISSCNYQPPIQKKEDWRVW